MQPYWKQIFIILFTRLNKSKTPVFAQRFARFFYFLVHRKKEGAGPDFAIKAMDEVQADVFGQVFTRFICPDTLDLSKPQDRKLAIIGLTKLLLTSTTVTVPPYNKIRPNAAIVLVKLVTSPEVVPQGPAGDDLSHEADLDEMGFAVTFSTLNTTRKPAADPAPEVSMPYVRAWVIENFKNSQDQAKDWLPVEARVLLGE